MGKKQEEELTDYTFQKLSVSVRNPATGAYTRFEQGDPVPAWCLGDNEDGNPILDEAHYVPADEEETDDVIGNDYSRMKVDNLRLLAADRGLTIPEKALKADIVEALENADKANG